MTNNMDRIQGKIPEAMMESPNRPIIGREDSLAGENASNQDELEMESLEMLREQEDFDESYD